MDNILNNNNSLVKVILIFYILIGSNFTPNLIGKQLKTFLNENRIAQHVIAFIMLLVLIMLIGNVNNIISALAYTTLGYLFFIFTTKMDIQWNIIILLALLIFFFYDNLLVEKENITNNDVNLLLEEKIKVKNSNNKTKIYVSIGIFIITLIGVYLYLTKKEVQYGGGKFDLITFLLY